MKKFLGMITILVSACTVTPSDESIGSVRESIKPPPGGSCSAFVTRTRGFWANHTCVLKGDATGYPLTPVTIGSTMTFQKPSDVEAYLSQPAKGDKQLILGAQLLAAKLNVAAFGIGTKPYVDFNGDSKVDTVNSLLAASDAAFDSGTDADRVLFGGILDKMNNSGDNEALWFSPTCSEPPGVCN